jgi:hypothetical protein
MPVTDSDTSAPVVRFTTAVLADQFAAAAPEDPVVTEQKPYSAAFANVENV